MCRLRVARWSIRFRSTVGRAVAAPAVATVDSIAVRARAEDNPRTLPADPEHGKARGNRPASHRRTKHPHPAALRAFRERPSPQAVSPCDKRPRQSKLLPFGRIPSPAGGIVEARPERSRVEKCGTNDLGMRDAIYQFKVADPAQPVTLPLYALVGRGIQLGRIPKHRLIVRDFFQDGSGFAEPGRNQPVQATPPVLLYGRSQRPPRQASSIRRTSAIPGWP